MPPHYGTWEIYSRRVELMMEAGAIEDYTFLWWDVRPHPNLGTVETRVFDQQTRLDDTAALAAMVHSLAHRLSALFDGGELLVEVPTELVDDNKVRAALPRDRGRAGRLPPPPLGAGAGDDPPPGRAAWRRTPRSSAAPTSSPTSRP